MRILDLISDRSLSDVTLYVEISEAKALRDVLKELLKEPLHNHYHLANRNFEKEVTVCIYHPNHLDGFNERSIDLILRDV